MTEISFTFDKVLFETRYIFPPKHCFASAIDEIEGYGDQGLKNPAANHQKITTVVHPPAEEDRQLPEAELEFRAPCCSCCANLQFSRPTGSRAPTAELLPSPAPEPPKSTRSSAAVWFGAVSWAAVAAASAVPRAVIAAHYYRDSRTRATSRTGRSGSTADGTRSLRRNALEPLYAGESNVTYVRGE